MSPFNVHPSRLTEPEALDPTMFGQVQDFGLPGSGNSQTSPIHDREDRHETTFADQIDESKLKSLH